MFCFTPKHHQDQFNVDKCKRLLKKIIVDALSVIETHKGDMDYKRVEIAKRLVTPLEHVAHYLAMGYVDDKNMIMLLEHIIHFCKLVADHLPLIESQREVPPDLKEAIASLCYAGSRYSELSDLKNLQSQFSRKYGEEFVANVIQGKEACGVNEKVVEWLFVPKPPVEERNKILKEVSDQFNLNWDPNNLFYANLYR